jgi:hypothetical protein
MPSACHNNALMHDQPKRLCHEKADKGIYLYTYVSKYLDGLHD